MKKQLLHFISATLLVASFFSMSAQTAGTLTFKFTQVAHSPCFTASKNVLAVWIQTNTGVFVKTKLRNAGTGTADHLPTWAVNSGGTSTNCMAAACNKTDATSGATLTSFGTKTITWDGKNVVGTVNGTIVADGVYKVTIQSTWNHGSGSTVTTSFTFTKGPTADHQTPANTADFTGITLDWVPGIDGVDDIASAGPEINVYPNPTIGLFNVDYSKATSVKVVDVLGDVIYNEKVDQNNSGTIAIDLANYANGIYFIYVFDGDNSSKRKLILSK
jgi:hypothetical protein